jgi:hypothetical protein
MPMGGRFGDKVRGFGAGFRRGGGWVAAKNTRVAWVGKEGDGGRKEIRRQKKKRADFWTDAWAHTHTPR